MNQQSMKVVLAMYRCGKPMRQVDIVKATRYSAQLVYYHVKQLIEKGVVRIEETEEDKVYLLQDVYYDSTLLYGMSNALAPLAEAVDHGIKYPDGSNEEEQFRVVVENIRCLVDLFCSTIGS